jgi:hypothetical protein
MRREAIAGLAVVVVDGEEAARVQQCPKLVVMTECGVVGIGFRLAGSIGGAKELSTTPHHHVVKTKKKRSFVIPTPLPTDTSKSPSQMWVAKRLDQRLAVQPFRYPYLLKELKSTKRPSQKCWLHHETWSCVL